MTALPQTLPCLSVFTLNLWRADIAWRERLELAAEEIRFWKPDVVCLQEVQLTTEGSTAEILAQLIHMTVAHRSPVDENNVATAILTSLEILEAESILFEDYEDALWRDSFTLVSVRSSSRRIWHVGTAHLAWGPHTEPMRLAQAETMVSMVVHREKKWDGVEQASVLTGDLNTSPDCPSVQYLTGRHLGSPATLWTDAWTVAGDGDGYTSTPRNYWAEHSAREVGIANPDWIPHRRIDYILAKGYAHGRPGTPLRAHLIGQGKGTIPPPSDHYGVIADLWDPPLS